MDTLDRFLMKEFFVYFIIIIFGMSLLFLGIDFLSNVWGMKFSIGKVLELYFYKIPGAIQQFVPVACLMGTLLVLSTMSRQNEILALYSSGIGTLRIVSIFITVVSLISTVSFLMFDHIGPVFAKRHYLVSMGLNPSEEHLLSINRTRNWYRNEKVIYNVGRFQSGTTELDDIHVFLLNQKFEMVQKINAKRAKFDGTDWILEEGHLVTYSEDGTYPIATPFKEKRGIIPEKPSDFKSFRLLDETMRLKDLRNYISKNRSYGFDTTAQSVTYHERVALIFTPLIFVLLAIPFGIKPLRTHPLAKSVAFCFISVFLYLLFFRLILSVGKGGHIPPVVAGWAPNIVFLSASLFFYRKFSHA